MVVVSCGTYSECLPCTLTTAIYKNPAASKNQKNIKAKENTKRVTKKNSKGTNAHVCG